MPVQPPSGDRRAALKAKSHRAILDAAADLMRQRGSADFSVDELAAAADVSRRTVFNHFDSLEDVVTTVAGELLGEVVDRMEAWATSESREVGTVLEDLAATASGLHLVPTMAYLIQIFDGEDQRQAVRGAVLMQRALSLFTQQMSGAIARRHPEVDVLKVDLLVAAFSGGLLGLVDRWIAATGATDTPHSRRVWDDLVSSLTDVLREPGA
ncbi:TetR/AcrR family transcriptional regulator [Glycomyces sp. L485]|uniref:TetR/AcrR family transcriptional regulator n=1 Tax=Glycomyces sp. L485 TaxID=2909235 RepID=UPI001F4B205D|nr:TetR/AcrR family transcriptional regulator [Glycomyces sp. L485]MCH7230581.1 TetR/AcrR family transcriptional regulator [Glycomyces sp. L485]